MPSTDKMTAAFRIGYADGKQYLPPLTELFASDEESQRMATSYKAGYRDGVDERNTERMESLAAYAESLDR